MTTSTPPNRHIGRSRLIAVVAAVLGVSLLVTGVVWGASRNGSPSNGPAAAHPAVTPTASIAARTPAANPYSVKSPVSPKKTGPGKPAAKKTGTHKTAPRTVTGKTAASLKKLPAGIAEPGREVIAPVDVKKTAVAASIRVDLTGFTSVTTKASGIGEISAPAVLISIRLTNTGTKALPLTSVVVNAYYGSAGTPGVQINGDPANKPFTGSLRPRAKATGVVVFNMPVSKRRDATVTVSPSPTLPIAVFAGSVS